MSKATIINNKIDTAAIALQVSAFLKSIGEDPAREGLKDTPTRVTKSWEYLTSGYRKSLDQIVNNALFTSDIDELVILKDIEIFSMCEHHLLPFIGRCHVAYLPNGKVLGISKIARIVEMFARRLQIQEQLTEQIANAILEVTGAKGVGVVIEAKHLCMIMRGVEKQNTAMTTSVMLGTLRENPKTRAEFLSFLNT